MPWLAGLAMALAILVLSQFATRLLRHPTLAGGAWWPAAGLSLAVLARSPRRWWPQLVTGIAVSSALSRLLIGTAPEVNLCFTLANVAECVIAARFLAGGTAHRSRPLASVADGIRLIAGAVLGVSAAASMVGVGYLAADKPWLPGTCGYVLSHGLGLVMLTPLLLAPTGPAVWDEFGYDRHNAEWVVQFALVTAASCWIFLPAHTAGQAVLVLPPLLWGAARLGALRAMISALMAAVLATVGTLNGHGALSSISDPQHRQWALQTLLAVICLATLILVLSGQARDNALAAAAEREDALAEAQRLAMLGSWNWDLVTAQMTWSDEMYRIFGVRRGEFQPSMQNWLSLVQPADRGRLTAAVRTALADLRPYELEFTLLPADRPSRVVHGRGRVHVDEHGTPVRMSGTAHDVTAARSAARELATARDLYRGVLAAASSTSIIGTDPLGQITVFNTGAEKMLGYTESEMLGSSPVLLHDPAELAERAAELGVAPDFRLLIRDADAARPEPQQWTYLTRSGRRLQVELTVTAMTAPDGSLSGYIGVASDVTSQRQAELALRESEQRFRLAFDAASVGMCMVSLDPPTAGRLIRANQAMCNLTGYTEAELLTLTVVSLSIPEDAEGTRAALAKMVSGEVTQVRRETLYRHADGSNLWGLLSTSTVTPADGSPPYAISLIEDITARKRAEAALTHQALHDGLTGLANRTLLLDRLEHGLVASARTGHGVGVAYLDLDGFKQVNDGAGHAAGDELLVQVASRLGASVRPGDTVGRLGGDEFAIICTDLTADSDLSAVAERVLNALREPFLLPSGTFTISASIGLATAEGHSTGEQLLAAADTAMYTAKRAGRDRVTVTDPQLQARAARSSRLRPQLETALSQDELVMYGQPVLDLRSGRIVAVETLLRWNHPRRGVLGPGEFLDVAESSALMIPIGRRVLRESCRMAASWADQLGERAPDVHVNISGRQLETGHLIDDVLAALAEYQVPPTRLVLELTETHMPLIADSLRKDLSTLRELGIRIAIDDLGTGYSSLTRITELPVDMLKIDVRFIAGLGTDSGCTAVVAAILEIGKTLELAVVAEGVETAAQARLLTQYGCSTAQGYLYSRARPEADLAFHLAGVAAGQPRRSGLGALALRAPA
ncbi:bifunctional diguanylate cyclase/phosphodiesterase [Jatrophihabitans sp.]|uniref:bifunctional diguanylate cyclase/phosphodiesterase n=1 Tax=Jatrophihabitans sp. TaxID=1932789 RepID=UPI002C51DB20|nr:EAL domain-containing protein [Jatrophihabitans sp.]